MKILVLNCGSSSIKYKLYNMDDKSVIAAGGIEKVGLEDSFLKTKSPMAEVVTTPVPTHDVGVELTFKTLTDPQKGCIKSLDEINAVGHRIAHGGKFTKSLLLTPEVLAEWKTYESLAPLHNPAHLLGIHAISNVLP
ncbi:MAG: acetate kinase, partial [Bacteroidaceae bacterium]